MRDIEILKQHPRKVLDSLKLGEVDSIVLLCHLAERSTFVADLEM